MAEYKYLSLAGLQRYDGKIKEWVRGLGYALDSNLTKVSDRVTAIENTYATVTSNALAGKTAADAWTIFLTGSNFTTTNAPKLADLATTASVNELLKSYYTSAQVDGIKTELEGKITAAGTNLTNNYYTKVDIDGKVNTINETAANNLAEAKGYTDTLKNTEVKANTDAISELTKTVAENKTAAEKLVDDLSKGQVATNKTNIEGLTTRMGTAEDNITTIQGWKINGNAITADTKLNASNLPMSGTDATTISTEIANIKSAISGGTHFIGVLESLDGKTPQAGDIFVASKDFGTFKADIEYIYDGTNWYELGNSSANAQAIADLTANKADWGTTLADYKITDAYTKTEVDTIKTNLETSINGVNSAAVKSIEGGSSTYVTVTAGAKDENGKVTLTVSDTIGTALDGKLDKTAKAADSAKLNGQEASYYATADSVTGVSNRVADIEKDYVKATEMVAITDGEIDALFATQA